MEITLEVNKTAGKKINSTEYEMQELIQYNESGEQVDFYDGSSVWYRVAKFVNGIPAGIKNFVQTKKKHINILLKQDDGGIEMQLTLVETKEIGNRKRERYEIARYTVRVFTHESGYKSIDVRKGRDDYLPDIYCRTDIEGNALAFEVQTTSYGSLPADEIRKVIEGLEEAAQVAEILTAEFVK